MSSAGMPRAPLRVASVQATPRPGEVPANAVLGARLVAQAAAGGARLCVLPELFLCAYHPPTLRRENPQRTHVRADADLLVRDGRLDPMLEASRDLDVVVVAGAAVAHADGRRTCTALVFHPDGSVWAGYDKRSLWGPDEQALFVAGDHGAAVELDGWLLALGVCYDGCFPEYARAAARDGAHAYLCPSGYVDGSQHRRDVYYAARALDNTMYAVFANSVGQLGEPPYRFNGGAAVYDPQGRAIAKAPDHGEAVILADFDPVELATVRQRHSMLAEVPEPPRGEMWLRPTVGAGTLDPAV